MVENTLLDQIRAAVSRLAAPAKVQIDYLRDIKTYPSADELALDFDDLAGLLSQLRLERGVSNEAVSLASALDDKLNSFSGPNYAADWDASALESSPNWAEVRSIAKRLLEALG